jgi:hypothetical protein
VIRFGLRLTLAGGREAAARLAVVGAAVAVGVGLLLSVLAGINGVQSQNQRYAWFNSAVTSAATGPEAADPAFWAVREDYFHGHSIARIDVAATGPSGPVPPGMSALPGPGQFVVSPALDRLLTTTPAGELADRWPGRRAGVLGDAALPSPDTLVVVVGRTPAEMARIDGMQRITRIVSVSPRYCNGCYVGIGDDGITLVLSVVAAALLFPLLMFIATATRLSAARREQRFAAMRLVGATPRQIAVLAGVESAVAAVAGTLAGFVLFLLLRPVLQGIPFTGERFFPGDLSLSAAEVLLVGIGVPTGAALAAWLALRRVRISPLGVSRRVTPRPPRAWRLILLVAGLAELAYFVGRRPQTTDGQTTAYLSGIFAVMIGLVVAGPYLTMAGSRILAGRARSAATLIAGRRLADDPKAGFRAVSGLMLALFVTSVATGVITTIVAERDDPSPGTAARDNLTMTSFPDDRPAAQVPLTAEAVPAALHSVPGVRTVRVIRLNPADLAAPDTLPGLIPCADLARIPDAGICPAGAEVAQVFTDLIGHGFVLTATDTGVTVWPAAPLHVADLARLPVLGVLVATDGSPAALERSRTLLEGAFPDGRLPATDGEYGDNLARSLVRFQRLADVVIIASLVIAGCSLAVTVTGGLNERKRPFSLLRLTGMRLADLRRVVTLESAVPLLVVAAVAIAVGFLAAALFLRSQLDYTLRPPGVAYYVIVGLGLAASLGVIASTMPLLRRLTGPETARNE